MSLTLTMKSKILSNKKKESIIQSILLSEKTGHGISIFSEEDVVKLEKDVFLKNEKPYVKCFVSGVDRSLKPEEIVRQLFARRLVSNYGYPIQRMAVEKSVYFGSTIYDKRVDIVVYHRESQEPYMIVEVKKAKRKDGEEQLKSTCPS